MMTKLLTFLLYAFINKEFYSQETDYSFHIIVCKQIKNELYGLPPLAGFVLPSITLSN